MDQRLRAVDLLHICKKSKKSEIIKDIREETRVQIEGFNARGNCIIEIKFVLRIIIILIMDVIFIISFSRKTSFCNMFLNQLNMNNLLILFLCKKYNYNFTNFNNK